MGMTMTEKILARASGASVVKPGDVVMVDLETIVTMDSTFQPERMSEERWVDVVKIADPRKVAVIFDHLIPANDVNTATAHKIGREFAKKFGIERVHDVGPDQGVAHSVVAEYGYAVPGTVLVGSDSHTCGSGAFNCAAIAVGRPDLVYAVVMGKTWFTVCETVRYDFSGKLNSGVTTKDVNMMIAGKWGAHVNRNIEYGGSGISTLSMDARRTLTTMGTELSGEFNILEPDELMLSYWRERNPRGTCYPTMPDADAAYSDRRSVDLSKVEPLVGLPGAVLKNTVPVREAAGEHIDQAFIGACSNGMLEDIAVAAKIVKGRKVAKGTRFIVIPNTQRVFHAALKAGYIETLTDAGAVVMSASCGPCCGLNLGILAPEEVCITASPRNFKGRMVAASSRVYLGSSATVAASAIAGKIVSAEEYFAGDRK
jgi:3-isopropylmalate/(R)-2-methylmalate dehydratase large subunit